MANKRLPNLKRAAPKVKPLGKPKASPKIADPPLDQTTRTPMLVNPKIRGTRRQVRTNFAGSIWNGTPEVE